MKWLLLALCSMFFQQSLVTIGKVLPAIIAPAIFDDLLIDANRVRNGGQSSKAIARTRKIEKESRQNKDLGVEEE